MTIPTNPSTVAYNAYLTVYIFRFLSFLLIPAVYSVNLFFSHEIHLSPIFDLNDLLLKHSCISKKHVLLFGNFNLISLIINFREKVFLLISIPCLSIQFYTEGKITK
jgi:hypothetical protein